jgi:uncharacterized protein YndB with AHSA1/START domain
MNERLVAKADIDVHAPASKVWDALIDPEMIKRYMFGATVESDWTLGSPISWKGEWKGKPYEDKGRILDIQPQHRLVFSHYSPLSGAEDAPENYHNVTIELDGSGENVHVALSQDNNKSAEAAEESRRNWLAMLAGLKQLVEGSGGSQTWRG